MWGPILSSLHYSPQLSGQGQWRGPGTGLCVYALVNNTAYIGLVETDNYASLSTMMVCAS